MPQPGEHPPDAATYYSMTLEKNQVFFKILFFTHQFFLEDTFPSLKSPMESLSHSMLSSTQSGVLVHIQERFCTQESQVVKPWLA